MQITQAQAAAWDCRLVLVLVLRTRAHACLCNEH